jgi:peptide/nickel transport system ATP-binding protein
METIIKVQGLKVYYKTIWGDNKSVDDISFDAYKGEVFSIAGESGCGKSTLVEGMLRLVKPPGFVPQGEVLLEGVDLLKLSEDELRKNRWANIAYVPQGAMNSLNPVTRVKEQMMDAIIEHSSIKKEEALNLVASLLKEVGLQVEVADMYPHELSGGMKQRVLIAAAIALKPKLVIADEPTTALDVVVSKGILQLLRRLKEDFGITVIVVSHDMAAHAEIADRIAIMYAGKIVEIGSIDEIFDDALHPYSKALISAIPAVGKKHVEGIAGLPPSPMNWPQGCRFHPRCTRNMEICSKIDPPMKEVAPGRYVACHLCGENP